MNKSELIERIIDTFTDMGSDDPVDTAACDLLTIDEATSYLNERRAMEKADLEPSDWLPEEVTPELYMEASNCYIRRCQYEVTRDRLAEYFTLGELVDYYHDFDGEYHSYTDKIVYPTIWLTENMEFPFTPDDLTMLGLIRLGQNSPDFDPDKKFCWYETKDDNGELHSTDTPFADGLIDAKAFAEWILANDDKTQYVKEMQMINTDIDYVFRYWRY